MDHSRPLFYFIFVFSTVYAINLLITDFCWWLDSNRRTSGIEINRSANWATTTIFRWVTANTFLAWTTLLNFLFVSMSWTAKESVQWKLSIEVSLVQIPTSMESFFSHKRAIEQSEGSKLSKNRKLKCQISCWYPSKEQAMIYSILTIKGKVASLAPPPAWHLLVPVGRSLKTLGTYGLFVKNSRYHWVVCSKLLCKLPQKKWVQRISVEKVLFSLWTH